MDELDSFPPIPEDNIDTFDINRTFQDDGTTYNTGGVNLTTESSFTTTPERVRGIDPQLEQERSWLLKKEDKLAEALKLAGRKYDPNKLSNLAPRIYLHNNEPCFWPTP
ncbi:hypothetical protein, partial [Bartonella sp. CL27QHWL]|uniref:hypothetical protein n=1 Tax=Bartonella sp. CL27QHWL TaxID=3243521 RepID=UPI0035D0F7CC